MSGWRKHTVVLPRSLSLSFWNSFSSTVTGYPAWSVVRQTVWSSRDCCVINRDRSSSRLMMVGSPLDPPTLLRSVETQRWHFGHALLSRVCFGQPLMTSVETQRGHFGQTLMPRVLCPTWTSSTDRPVPYDCHTTSIYWPFRSRWIRTINTHVQSNPMGLDRDHICVYVHVYVCVHTWTGSHQVGCKNEHDHTLWGKFLYKQTYIPLVSKVS